MIKFYTYKKHQKNTRHQKYQKTVLNFLFIFFFMVRFYTQKKHKKNSRHQKALKVQKYNQAKAKNASKRTKIKNALKKHLRGKKLLICVKQSLQ